tara:strand:- start:39 stop:317 length:279 start_codon:yes stop_codon:yes gene_type:complete
MNNNIIPGYKGIMDLDVTNIDPRYIKQALDQHYNDIKKYTLEQSLLKPHLRYENTVLRIIKLRRLEHISLTKRKKEKENLQEQYDKRREQYY